MITKEEDVEAHALRQRGWSISVIARHLGRDRETVRVHLKGEREAGARTPSEPDPLERFVPYLRQRNASDPHVWATALFDEVRGLGFERSYPSFTRLLRRHDLRPRCEACQGVAGRATVEIDHPAGEEMQWDRNELPDAPWGTDAHLLVGTLPHSGRIRGAFAPAEDQAHLVEPIDATGAASAAPPGVGGSTAWPPSSFPAAGTSRPASPRWPSTTGWPWTPARPGGPTARARWRSRSTT